MQRIKYVIISGSPFTSWWLDTMCTDELANCFDLQYWDCSKITFPFFESHDTIDRMYVKKFTLLDCFKNEIKTLPKDTVILTDVCFVRLNYKFYKILSRYFKYLVDMDIWSFDVKSVLSQTYNYGEKNDGSSFKAKTLFWYFSQFSKKILKYGVSRKSGISCKDLYTRWKEEREMKYEKKCTSLFKKIFRITWESDGQYVINLPDYEKFLKIRNEVPLEKGKYILYLDQYIMDHPDYLLGGDSCNSDNLKDSFYLHLNNYFDYLEKTYDCKVIIAGHPRANYAKNPYGGRKIIFYKTAELVRDSFAVCGHSSLSFIYVFLFDKPYAILSDEVIKRFGQVSEKIETYSKLLDYPIIHLEDQNEFSIPYKVLNRDIKRAFMDKLKGNREELTNDVLFYNNIVRIHDELVSKL